MSASATTGKTLRDGLDLLGSPHTKRHEVEHLPASVLKELAENMSVEVVSSRTHGVPVKGDYLKALWRYYKDKLQPSLLLPAPPPPALPHKDDSGERHCVRCHASYSPLNPEGCIVPHVFDAMSWHRVESPEFGEEYRPLEPVYRFHSGCCGKNKQLFEHGTGKGGYTSPEELGDCFKGTHTSNPSKVTYNGVNVLRCSRGSAASCKRECLQTHVWWPVFVGNYDRW